MKIAWGDATEFLLERAEAGSLHEAHLYHPQPYYEPGTERRRQLTPAVLLAIHRALAPGGLFVFQTDNAAYARYAKEIVPVLFSWFGFFVVAGQIGVELGLIRPTNYVALVAAGLLSVIIFPLVALTLLRGRQEPERVAAAPAEASARASGA